MSEYIERDQLMTDRVANDPVRIAAKCAPAADVKPIQHGQWIKISGMAPPEYHGKHRCSLCGAMALDRKFHEELSDYCPYCGAKMDGGFDE